MNLKLYPTVPCMQFAFLTLLLPCTTWPQEINIREEAVFWCPVGKKDNARFPSPQSCLQRLQDGKPGKIALMDVERVFSDSRAGKKVFQKVQARIDPQLDELNKQHEILIALQNDFKTKEADLSGDARRDLVRRIDDMTAANNAHLARIEGEIAQAQGRLASTMISLLAKYCKLGYALDSRSPKIWYPSSGGLFAHAGRVGERIAFRFQIQPPPCRHEAQ